MILYLEGKTKIPDLAIDFIEVVLTNGKIVSLTWDESDVKNEEGDYTTRYKGVYFDEEYANGKLDELRDLSISYISVYSESQDPVDLYISRLIFEDYEREYVIEDIYQAEDITEANEHWDKLKTFAVEWLEKHHYDLSEHFNIVEHEDTSGLYDVFYDMKSDVQMSCLNPYLAKPTEFDRWYDELAAQVVPILKNIAYESEFGGGENV